MYHREGILLALLGAWRLLGCTLTVATERREISRRASVRAAMRLRARRVPALVKAEQAAVGRSARSA